MLNNKNLYNLLLVDDTPENLRFLSTSLSNEGYKIRVAPCGELAFSMAIEQAPHLVLLDIDMPDMNGYQVCDKFKSSAELKKIPIIFLSALHDNQAKVLGFEHGGVDYVTKPFRIEELLARISTHLELQDLREELQQHNNSLAKMVADQFEEIHAAQLTTILALIKLAESRDDDTGKHIDRVGFYAQLITREARKSTRFNCEINDQFESCIFHSAAIHDLGKVGISDAVLLKQGKLTPEEFELIKTHPAIGFDVLKSITNYQSNFMLIQGGEVAYSHHEKWDGSGYPQGLKGEAIPLSARISAIADVYDALRSKRPYKNGFSHEDATNLIVKSSGTHFDPYLIEIFQDSNQEFNEIWLTHS